MTFNYNCFFVWKLLHLDKLYGLHVASGSLHKTYDLMKNYPRQFVNIRERINLQYQLYLFNIDQYLPPLFKDSNFFLDFQTIIFKKNFTHLKIINHLWVIETWIETILLILFYLKSISKIINSGLINFWINQFNLKKFKNHVKQDHFNQKDLFEELILAQLFYVFEAYYFGIIICFITFLLEIYFYQEFSRGIDWINKFFPLVLKVSFQK